MVAGYLGSLGMHFDPRQSRVIAAFVYGIAALYSAVSLWLVLSSALTLDDENRIAVLSGLRSLLTVWALVCGLGIIFAILALRFARLSVTHQRAMLVASCCVALVAGLWLEWWQSLYFLFPAVVLVFAFRETVHA